MKRFRLNFYIFTVFAIVLVLLLATSIYEINAEYSITLVAIVLCMQAIYLYVFLQFRKGIQHEGNLYRVPTLSGELCINKNDIKSMLVEKRGLERLLDFSTITLQLKSGNLLKFILPDSMIIKMGDYSGLN